MTIDFLEDFVLVDRQNALHQLIPGTDDYYFYHCLSLQLDNKYTELDPVLRKWEEQFEYSHLRDQIVRRQKLLAYAENPEDTLEYLRYELGLSFNHHPTKEHASPHYPSVLDPSIFDINRLTELAFMHTHSLSKFTDSALEWLVASDRLSIEQIRNLLDRIQRPDYPQLPDLVLKDLQSKKSSGFGAKPIHARLLKNQLHYLADKMPSLNNDKNFVTIMLHSLHPDADSDWRENPVTQKAYLEKLWRFASTLKASFNSLKSIILYHMLSNRRDLGEYDRPLFEQYLNLPKQSVYISAEFMEHQHHIARLDAGYQESTLLTPVYDDEPLVRDYFNQLFINDPAFEGESSYRTFCETVDSDYLKALFALSKLGAGIGDQETWHALLNNPSRYQSFQDQVLIEFSPQNSIYHHDNSLVSLDVDLKNVPTLLVKIFQINTLNYCLAYHDDIDTSIDLDGLVAKEEQVHHYQDPPIRRIRRTFSFEKINMPGVYVVEFIGNGISSRALIRKGRLHYTERLSAAGHALRVYDDKFQPLPSARIWLGHREYQCNDYGDIVVPYTTRPERCTMLIHSGDIVMPATLLHKDEDIRFSAGLFINREQLIRTEQATVVVSPQLSIHGERADIRLLQNPVLLIQTRDRDGIESQIQAPALKLDNDKDSEFTCKVPQDLESINVTLSGTVKLLTSGEEKACHAEKRFFINGIDQTERLDDLHLCADAGGYSVLYLGKTGEPRGHQPLTLQFTHKDFSDAIETVLQTDGSGRVRLGKLEDITTVSATNPGGNTATWTLLHDQCQYPGAIHAAAGSTIRLPFFHNDLSRISLLARNQRDGFLQDCREHAAISQGMLEITGLQPGNYSLQLKDHNAVVDIAVGSGVTQDGWLLTRARLLQINNPTPLHITDVSLDDTHQQLCIKISGHDASTRVHVFGGYFTPAFKAFDCLQTADPIALTELGTKTPRSCFVSGRDIGDEYRYILERKYADKFPGNMLTQPGLLLNPWATRDTETGLEQAGAGGAYGAVGEGAPEVRRSKSARRSPKDDSTATDANLDFLPNGFTQVNRVADQNGDIRVPLAPAGESVTCQHFQVIAVNRRQTVARYFHGNGHDLQVKNLRLAQPLATDRHYCEQNRISPLYAGGKLEISDISTVTMQWIDTLAKVYHVLKTLSQNETLEKFAFILDWPTFDNPDKGKKYSEFACHELNFFLHHKDPAYFNQRILPYLQNKRHKTFLDHYLLQENLYAYLRPWAFSRLNIVERILLLARFGRQSDGIRSLKELTDIHKLRPEQKRHLFETVLQQGALGTADELGMDENREKAKLSKPNKRARQFAAKAMPAAPVQSEMAQESIMDFDEALEDSRARSGELERDFLAREEQQRFFRKADKTKEYAENHYYHVRLADINHDLIQANRFWLDFASHQPQRPFMSPHFAEAAGNFSEIMMALAVLELPFESRQPAITFQQQHMTMTPSGNGMAFCKQLEAAQDYPSVVPILVSQNYLCLHDRYDYNDDMTKEKHISGDMLTHTVYLCQVVITNPTSQPERLQLLMQIPHSSIPVNNGFYTKTRHIDVAPYATETVEYCFYFAETGSFDHYPAQIHKDGQYLCSAREIRLNVVATLDEIDADSWQYISQHAATDDVIDFLDNHNLHRLNLDLILWRMKDRDAFDSVLSFLEARCHYHDGLWSYAIHHNEPKRIGDYLEHHDSFLQQCGKYLQSDLLQLDAEKRCWYEHLEYFPLIHARAHRLGGETKILNAVFDNQYHEFLRTLTYHPVLGDREWLEISYYLFLQGRVSDALQAFAKVNRNGICEHLQFDYLSIYAAFYNGDTQAAFAVARRHQEHTVDRWRLLFNKSLAFLNELHGDGTSLTDANDTQQQHDYFAASQPTFDFTVQADVIRVQHRAIEVIQVNYYLMDIELLFSRQPFLQEGSQRFSMITPGLSQTHTVVGEQSDLDIPTQLHGKNCVIEVCAAGDCKSYVHYTHNLIVEVVQQYGSIRVRHKQTGQGLARVYVKVFARMDSGDNRFYKDGYTDLRGCFDYVSLSTDEQDHVQRFALMIISDEHGSLVKETDPPKI